MAGNRIFSQSDADHLQRQGLLGPVSNRGTRKLHKRRAGPVSELEHQDIPLDVRFDSPDADHAFTSVPDRLISQATLEYIGFSEDKARSLWAQWEDWPAEEAVWEADAGKDGLRMPFEVFFTGIFDAGTDTASSNDDNDKDQQWKKVMGTFGLSEKTQKAIMDPLLEDLRHAGSCACWAKDTVRRRYAGLKAIQRASRDRDAALRIETRQLTD